MNRDILVKQMTPFIEDFHVLVNYLIEKEPFLTKSGEVLGQKDCFAINNQLNLKTDVTEAKYQQKSYFSIDFLFSLLAKNSLFVAKYNDKGKAKLSATSLLEEFLKLNIYEQFTFLFQSYWTSLDFDSTSMFLISQELRYIIEQLSKGKTFICKKAPQISLIFYPYIPILKYLQYFGLCILNNKEGSVKKFESAYNSIAPTELGIFIFSAVKDKALFEVVVNNGAITNIPIEDSIFDLLNNAYPDLISNTLIGLQDIEDTSCSIILKVFLEKKIWRKIKISNNHTLHDLHMAIISAFEFDNDHLYEFMFKTGSYLSQYELVGNPIEGVDIELKESNLYIGQRFDYIYDFGADWRFVIQVMDICKKDKIEEPELIESKGTAPDQYRW